MQGRRGYPRLIDGRKERAFLIILQIKVRFVHPPPPFAFFPPSAPLFFPSFFPFLPPPLIARPSIPFLPFSGPNTCFTCNVVPLPVFLFPDNPASFPLTLFLNVFFPFASYTPCHPSFSGLLGRPRLDPSRGHELRLFFFAPLKIVYFFFLRLLGDTFGTFEVSPFWYKGTPPRDSCARLSLSERFPSFLRCSASCFFYEASFFWPGKSFPP